MLSASEVEAQSYICPPGWTQGDSITHLIDINGTPTVITIYWCYRPSQNNSPYSDIYIGGWKIGSPTADFYDISGDDLIKLIVAYNYDDLGFNGPYSIPVCPNQTPELFRVYHGGCYRVAPPIEDPITSVSFVPCDPEAPPKTCVEGYVFCYEFTIGGNLELVMESVGMTYDFECFPIVFQGPDDCFNFCQ